MDGTKATAVPLVEPLLPPSQDDNDDDVPQIAPSAPPEQEQQDDEERIEPGETQPPKCQDVSFAILFLIQFGVVLFFCITSLKSIDSSEFAIHDDDDDDGNSILNLVFSIALPFVYISLLSSGTALFLSIGGMSIANGSFCTFMIKFALILSPISFTLSAVYAATVLGDFRMTIMFAVLALLGMCYATSAWHRIPFAASNLATAICSIRVHMSGILMISIVIVLFNIGWMIACCIVFLGYAASYEDTTGADKQQDDHDKDHTTETVFVVLGLALSYFWTWGVLHNILHCTVTGVVGTWWFAPSEASDCCSPALCDSLFRSVTYSFGSICFGSLILAVVQVVHLFIRIVRAQEEEERRRHRRGNPSIYLCLLDCLLKQLERLVKYVNRWAFVYVGLYGYDFLTSGSRVWTLFRNRGWSIILNDDLVHQCLTMMSVIIGLICGVVANLLVIFNPSWTSSASNQEDNDDIDKNTLLMVASGLGFLYGIVISKNIFKPIQTAVDTVVVCFAEAPHEFCRHYPQLSQRMRHAWSETYPSEFHGEEFHVEDP